MLAISRIEKLMENFIFAVEEYEKEREKNKTKSKKLKT